MASCRNQVPMPLPPLTSSQDLTKFQDRRLFWHPGLWCGLGSEEGQGWCEGRGPERGAPGGDIRPRWGEWAGSLWVWATEGPPRGNRECPGIRGVLQGPAPWLQGQEFQEGSVLWGGTDSEDSGFRSTASGTESRTALGNPGKGTLKAQS